MRGGWRRQSEKQRGSRRRRCTGFTPPPSRTHQVTRGAESMQRVASQARVVINRKSLPGQTRLISTVGPYAKYGYNITSKNKCPGCDCTSVCGAGCPLPQLSSAVLFEMFMTHDHQVTDNFSVWGTVISWVRITSFGTASTGLSKYSFSTTKAYQSPNPLANVLM